MDLSGLFFIEKDFDYQYCNNASFLKNNNQTTGKQVIGYMELDEEHFLQYTVTWRNSTFPKKGQI